MDMGFLTLMLVILTTGITFWAFNNAALLDKLLLYPRVMSEPKEYYRFLTNGFVHADMQHLIFNMITLFFIGSYVEGFYAEIGMRNLYLLLYVAGVIVASVPSYFRHRTNPYYRSLGASGGTSAIMFSMVYISPWMKITFFFIPMWSVAFAVLYVAYSIYAAKQRQDNINHEAHLWGGVFGFVFTFLFDPTHGQLFLFQILNPPFLGH